jgi:outer membrane protein OmpA-like peptidoglycan-associated protein
MTSFLESVKDSSSVKTDSVKTISSQTTLLKGIITDAQTGSPLEATIEVVDNQKNVVIASFNSNSSSGKYLISLPSGKNYGIAVKSNGYLFHSENFDIPVSGTYQEIEKNIALNKIAAGSKIILNNIFFDTGKSDLRKESTNELERLLQLMNEVLTLKIEISGHTDNVGSADYNKGLSEARAKSVVDYLIKKGIDKERMVFKGYGFTQPIADNSTEEGRQLNRRTEFKILSK